MVIEFFIPQDPQGKKAPVAAKIGGFTRILKAAKTRKYEAMVSLFASEAMQGRSPLDEPVSVHLAVWLAIPASWSAKKRAQALAGLIRPTVKPDCSNVAKAIEDGCNGIVFVDDKQVTDLTVAKRYGNPPGVAVMVRSA